MRASRFCATGIFVVAAAMSATSGYSHDTMAEVNSLRMATVVTAAADTPSEFDAQRYAAPARAPALTAKAVLKSVEGKEVGTVLLTQTKAGVRLRVSVTDLSAGEHGFHIHAVGKCEPPFTSAGPHFNPNERKHGLRSREGHHAGDMRNLRILKSGKATATLTNADVTLEKDKPNSLFKEGGTSIVIHADVDDQLTDPSGNSGDRIACGVITELERSAALVDAR